MSEAKPITVSIRHGNRLHIELSSLTDILPENIPKTARALMDQLYLRLDDQVDVAKFRAHRRRLRTKHRERAVGQILTTQEKGAGE